MENSMHRGRKSTSPPATTASYMSIAAFDSMAFPAAGDLSLDYFDHNLMGSGNHSFHEMGNTPEEYYGEANEEDSPFSSQQLYQHHLHQQYHSNQSTDPSSLNTPSIEVRFEDLYDNLHITENDKPGGRLSSNIHTRRRAQNRASQRAFRERKEQHVKEVEAKLAETEAKYESLEKEYLSTKQELEHLKVVHRQLGGGEGNRLPESQHAGDASYLDDVFFFDGDAGDQPYASR